MKFLIVLWTCLVVGTSAFSLDREAFAFTNYNLKIQLEPEQQRLGVRGTIKLRNDSASPQKNVSLQISSSLTWRSIQAEGKPLQFVSQPFTSDIDHTGGLSEAIVTLPQEVPPRASVELTIGYEGVIALDATRLTRIGMPEETAKHSDWDQIGKVFSAVRGVGYVTWYPVATEAGNLSDKDSLFEVLARWKRREQDAVIEVELTHSQEDGQIILFCNTNQSDAKANGSDNRPSTDCEFAPLATRVPTFVAGNYAVLERPNTQIAYRPEHKANAEKFANAADSVAPFVQEWFGPSKEKAQVLELVDMSAAAFESGATLLTPVNDADPNVLKIALLHQLVHGAFSSPREWINEGVAHFAEAEYRERQAGRAAAIDLLALHRQAVISAEQSLAENSKGKSAEQQSLVSTGIDEFYRSKAAYVWWMLRDMVGEETLKKVLAAYQPDQDKDAGYLQHLVESHSKRDLQWFFHDWVYHDRGLPDFRVESAFPRKASQNNYLLSVTIENLGAAGAEVPIIVRFDGGETTERVEVRGRSKATVRVAIPKVPTEVVVNDGSVPETNTGNNVFKVTAPPS